jgi:hypothetical protein
MALKPLPSLSETKIECMPVRGQMELWQVQELTP